MELDRLVVKCIFSKLNLGGLKKSIQFMMGVGTMTQMLITNL
jgi:hypothetical protein